MRWTGPHYLPYCWDGRQNHRKRPQEHLRHVQSPDEAGGEGAQPEPSLKLEANGVALAAPDGHVQLPENACGYHGWGHNGLCQALRRLDCRAGPTRDLHSHCPKQGQGCCPACQRLKSPAAGAGAAAAAAAAYVPYAVSLAGSKTGCGKAQHQERTKVTALRCHVHCLQHVAAAACQHQSDP